MNETITLKITMSELEKLLLNHYKKTLSDENIRLVYKVNDDDGYKEVKITIIKQTKVGNFSGEIKCELNYNEVLEVVNDELGKSGYQTKNLWYRVMRDTVEEIEFDVVKTNSKQKGIGGIKWNFKN